MVDLAPARIYNPRPYQRIIYNGIIDRPRVIINAQMGLGKTVATASSLEALQRFGEDVFPAIVFAPRRVALGVWPDEFTKWAHLRGLRISAIIGDARERLAALRRKAEVYTINYENVGWLADALAEHKTPWPFRTVIADEATRLKNFRLKQGGKRAAVLGKIAHETPRWINLTGSPRPTGLIDLWGQVWFIDGGRRLGRTMDAFRQRWFRPSFTGFGVEPLPTAEAEITERIADISIVVKSADWLPIEKPTTIRVDVALPEPAMRTYNDMERRMYTEMLSEPLEVFSAAAKSTKCLQIAAGFAYMDKTATRWDLVHDEKIDALRSIFEESSTPILVAYQWRTDAERIIAAFPKIAQILDQKPATIDRWNAGKIPMLLAHPQSAGHGLNLQDGSATIVFFSSWWNLEYDEQVIERIGPVRQLQSGHPRPVTIYRIVARDTIDEDVLDRLATKGAAQDIMLDRLKRKYG